jgi:AcrR family transcriptional regulator
MNVAQESSSRDRILDAALDLFARQGYAATSMRQIATAVGMRAPSLYNHFAGKEAILAALIDAHGPAVSATRLASPRMRALADDPAAFCRQYAADSLDLWLDPDEWRFMALLTAERDRLEGNRGHFVDTLFETEVGVAANYFRGFALKGLIHAPNPTECARLFMAALTFVRMQHLLMPLEPSPREVIAKALERGVDNFLQLIAPRN